MSIGFNAAGIGFPLAAIDNSTESLYLEIVFHVDAENILALLLFQRRAPSRSLLLSPSAGSELNGPQWGIVFRADGK